MSSKWKSKAAVLGAVVTGVLILALPRRPQDPGGGPGVPPPPPVGDLTGQVSDVAGQGVEGVHVALFDAETLALLENVQTDVLGRFAFQERPPSMHVYAQPAATHSLTGQWIFDLDGASTTTLDLVLQPGYLVHVHVENEAGTPVTGATVRAYDARADLRGNIAMKAQATTDAAGNASFLAPARTHLAALAGDQGFLPTWKFRRRVSPSGKSFTLVMSPGVPVTGHVRSDSFESLEGIVVSAWGYNAGWHWSGYMESDSTGCFSVMGGPKWTRVNAVDPDGEFVSSSRQYRTTNGTIPDVVLAEGNPLEVLCVDPFGVPIKSRVWFYSYETRSWSWGGTTDDNGMLQGMVSASYAVKVRPLSGNYIGANLYHQTYGEAQLTLEMKPARSVEIQVTNELSGFPLEDIEVRGYVDEFVYVGRGYTDSNGALQLSMPTFGLARFKVRDLAADSLIKPGWYTLNLGEQGDTLNLRLAGLVEISGDIETLDGQEVTDHVMVSAWDADTGAQTGRWLSRNSHYRINVAERYHLRFVPVETDSRCFPTYHWWNQLPADLVHARNPARMTQGWFGDVQVQSLETGGPVAGVKVRGGYPGRTTGADGWAKQMLFRPVYTLRNYPPPVSGQSPNPIIPDLVRVYQTIESDHTVDANAPLEPIRVFTEVGTIATGKVVGPLPDGGVGPIPGVKVRAHGGRRPLGWAMTNAEGDFSVLAVKYTPEYEFETDLFFQPGRTKPYLPASLNDLALTADLAAGERDEVGTVTLDAAAFGEGTVVDAFGTAVTDHTVFYVTRRWDQGPRWHLGGYRVSRDGSFQTKIAPTTWFRFKTKFWNNTWENKYFTQDHSFTLGQNLDLGTVELGKAALVEVRAVTSVADFGGSAAPIAQVYVELIDDATGRVYDWRRTDGSGEVQLRGPSNVPLRLRYSFWQWTYSIGGVGFDKVTSDFFLPQLSQPFTLTAEKTDFGDVYITSPLRHAMEDFQRFIYSQHHSAFAYGGAQRAIYDLAWNGGRVATPAGQKVHTEVARALIVTGIDIYTEVEALCNTLITAPDVQAEAIRLLHAVLNDLALLHDSLEDK